MDNHPDSLKITEEDREIRARLERLSRYGADKQIVHNSSYSAFIRRLRLILPLVAVAIIAALLVWPSQDSDIAVLEEEQKEALKTIRKNELTNPKFQSVDDKNQPYTITAHKAVQDERDEDLLLLETPVGDLQLTSGNWVAIKAVEGEYWQAAQKLDLKGDVRLFHDEGYEMTMAALHLNLKDKQALSDSDVSGHGPAGSLEAKGLKADNNNGVLIFTGPAKLVLKDSGSLQGLNTQGASGAATDKEEGEQ